MSEPRGLRAGPRLRPDEFRLLRDLINEHAGLHFDDDAMFLFDRRLGERVERARAARASTSTIKYLRFSIRGQAELEDAIELLTTKETYFFRQEYQLRAFQRGALAALAPRQRASRRRLTIWSAGCSTGEEVYTIAVLLHESGLFEGWDVRIIGSDISKLSVAAAPARRLPRRRRSAPPRPSGRRRYFIEQPDGAHVIEPIRETVPLRPVQPARQRAGRQSSAGST